MIKQYSLNLLTDATNRVLRLDHDIVDKLAPLEGKVIHIILLPLRASFYLTFTTNQIIFLAQAPKTPDTTIESSPIGLIRLSLLPASKTRSLFNDNVKISGDIHTGEQVKSLFDALDLDWETHLAYLTGDVAAYQIGLGVKKILKTIQHTHQSMQANINEYLQEEACLLPPKEAMDDFFNEIDMLKNDVARLEARIEQWQKLL